MSVPTSCSVPVSVSAGIGMCMDKDMEMRSDADRDMDRDGDRDWYMDTDTDMGHRHENGHGQGHRHNNLYWTFFYIGYRTASMLGLSDTGVDFNIDIVNGPTLEQDSDNVFSYGKLNLFKRLKNITGADEKSPGVV